MTPNVPLAKHLVFNDFEAVLARSYGVKTGG